MRRLLFYLLLITFLSGCSKALQEKISSNTLPGKHMSATALAATGTSGFKGVNWADPADNFKDGWVVPSGLSSSDNYVTTQIKAANIINGFQQRGINTIRIPINPPTVLEAWWGSYTGAIDTAANAGMKVILGCWEGSSSRNGLVDDYTLFWNMWQTVVNKYGNNSNVYFEVFNEPHGYSLSDLNNLYADWLTHYPTVPKNRVLLDGAGYATDVNGVGADSRLSACLLSYHNYTWFDNNKTTVADWEAAITAINYPERTIVTEFGIPMTNGKDYLGAPGQDREIAYFQGITNRVLSRSIGSVYWPGLRTGDSYSLLTLNGTTLTTNNASGLSRLQYAWGNATITQPYGTFDGNAWYKIICRQSNKSLDVYGSSTINGGNIIQWDYWGGNNQQWKLTSLGNGLFSIINRNSGKALDVNNSSTTGGTGIIQWDYWGGVNQQWKIVDMGFGYFQVINANSSQSLDVNGASGTNGAGIIQWPWSGNTNQQWQIIKL
ncbi:ricin-type beta-trefoil lectin protein [Chitinophaga niastensis]|uniref:Ricin-type beta-trefoil lectin protein n=1 Tax=Chitinophaga niastensis TaxID=536980 RepID=A0A2P8HDJ0_CHINA|nr:RICIN domain-containing protein [Chitinophaga niastensis]PSL44305.1 ricin-type beta-trefoil lectin protein [Chitinophaga niastensis]